MSVCCTVSEIFSVKEWRDLLETRVRGRSRLLKMEPPESLVRYLFALHSNYVSIWYHFRDKARYWPKIAIFPDRRTDILRRHPRYAQHRAVKNGTDTFSKTKLKSVSVSANGLRSYLLSPVSILTRDIDIANLSVRLSVYLSVRQLRSGIGWKRLNISL